MYFVYVYNKIEIKTACIHYAFIQFFLIEEALIVLLYLHFAKRVSEAKSLPHRQGGKLSFILFLILIAGSCYTLKNICFRKIELATFAGCSSFLKDSYKLSKKGGNS